MIANKIYKTMIIIGLIFEPLLVSHLGVLFSLLVFEQAIYYPPIIIDLDISSKYDY